jgi:large subunit ribosomal protein L17
LARSLFIHGRITTTEAKAKEARRIVEKLITLGKKGELTSRRRALEILPDKDVVKLVWGMAETYRDRPGGCTRVIKLGPRKGDCAPMAVLELV